MTRNDADAPVLTLDGPSGAGKGAVAARVATILGWNVLDSGAVYRSVAVAALDCGIDDSDEAALVRQCRRLNLAFAAGSDGIDVCLDGRPVGDRLRAEDVSAMSSKVAALAAVREALLDLQRSFRRWPGLVADGRDMGTVVFPDAPVKVFLEASLEERAHRRHKQLKEKGENVNFSRLFRDLQARDKRDRERTISPTRPAADATILDSTHMEIDEVVRRVVGLVRER